MNSSIRANSTVNLSKRAALELQQLFAETSKYELELIKVLEVQVTWRLRGEAVLCRINTPEPLIVIVYEVLHLADAILLYFQEKHLAEVLARRDPVTISDHDFISRSTSNTSGSVIQDFADAFSIASCPAGNWL